MCNECNTLFSSVSPPTKVKKAKPAIQPSAQALSMGDWIYDREKGMPKIYAPNELPRGKLSKEEIREYVSYEGLGFCIFEYIEPKKIEDAKLREKWNTTKKAMIEVVKELYD